MSFPESHGSVESRSVNKLQTRDRQGRKSAADARVAGCGHHIGGLHIAAARDNSNVHLGRGHKCQLERRYQLEFEPIHSRTMEMTRSVISMWSSIR